MVLPLGSRGFPAPPPTPPSSLSSPPMGHEGGVGAELWRPVGDGEGSHNRSELVVIRPRPWVKQQAKGVRRKQVCQICGDAVGITDDDGVFLACNECAFPVCRPFYEYECKEGDQCRCQTRYKRLKEL